MIELNYQFAAPDTSIDVTVRLSDVGKVRDDETPAPWAVHVTILWGEQVVFDRPLAGADPLHAVELAAQFAARYIRGRASDEGGTLTPPIATR